MTHSPDPAIKSYFFGKGYRDLRDTIQEAWSQNLESAQEYFAQSKYAWHDGDFAEKLLIPVLFFSAIAILVFGTLLTALLSCLHVILLVIFFSLIYLGFSIVAGVEAAVFIIRKFVSVCPVCHEKFGLPVYRCDNCGERHYRLVPSSFGILYHQCMCGQLLPCTIFTNRGHLQAECPSCQSLLSKEHTETRKSYLMVVGAPSVGKSAYLFSLCRHLREKTLPAMGLEARFLDHGQEALYQSVIEAMDEGIVPDKTADTSPQAFDLLLSRNEKADSMLYLYDPAGEAFLEEAQMVQRKELGYFSGIIFLIDPFSIQKVADQYAHALKHSEQQNRPSQSSTEDTLSRLLHVMQTEYGLSPTQRVQKPLAVVINKVDAFDLEAQIGEAALQHFPALADETAAETQNRLIRQWLAQQGEAPLVHSLETHFAKLRYFTVSALGHAPDKNTKAFYAKRVEEPALWILAQHEKRWM